MTQQDLFDMPEAPRDPTVLDRVKIGEVFYCEHCAQLCKLYPVPINGKMAGGLRWIVGEFRRNPRWIHFFREVPYDNLKTMGGSFAKMAHWGLIEQMPNADDPTKKCSGMWRPTQEGMDFADGKIRVPRAVKLYNGDSYGFTDDGWVSIHDIWDKQFDFQEIMQLTHAI